jgi:II/X family phage/plasmid replication protein
VIDWLDIVAPLAHEVGKGGPLYAGELISTTKDGDDIEWSVGKRLKLEGSHSTTITVATSTTSWGAVAVRISGNPAKLFQGHNIFGSNDVVGLVFAMLERVCAAFGLAPSETDREFWDRGLIELLRVDVTDSKDFGTETRVLAAIRSLERTANLKFRGRGEFNGHSLLYGKGSRHWSLTLYCKSKELKVKGHGLHELLKATSLPSVAEGLLRMECRLLSQHLRRSGLHLVANWGDNTAAEVHREHLELLQIAEAVMIEPSTLEGLPGTLQLVYQSWTAGHDLRQILPRRTFYKRRQQLLAHGIDIGVKQPPPEESNVVALRVVLLGKPFEVPAWAVGTPLYFEPAHRSLKTGT